MWKHGYITGTPVLSPWFFMEWRDRPFYYLFYLTTEPLIYKPMARVNDNQGLWIEVQIFRIAPKEPCWGHSNLSRRFMGIDYVRKGPFSHSFLMPKLNFEAGNLWILCESWQVCVNSQIDNTHFLLYITFHEHHIFGQFLEINLMALICYVFFVHGLICSHDIIRHKNMYIILNFKRWYGTVVHPWWLQ